MFAATPPTIISSFFLVNANARSVASAIIAKAVSCNEKQALLTSFELIFFVAESNPENDTSFPLTAYGKSMYLVDFVANSSIFLPHGEANPNERPN